MGNLRILFLGKSDDPYTLQAFNFLKNNGAILTPHFSGWGTPREEVTWWEGDYIISYLGRYIVPKYLLKRASKAAINFHPGPPEYPGTGCVNFALFHNAQEYGVTCHHMAKKVDSGSIIATKQFPIYQTDTVESLLQRTYAHQISLFYEIMDCILKGEALPVSIEEWIALPSTRSDLNELATIDPYMSDNEINQRIRATTYKEWKPCIELHGHRFVFEGE